MENRRKTRGRKDRGRRGGEQAVEQVIELRGGEDVDIVAGAFSRPYAAAASGRRERSARVGPAGNAFRLGHGLSGASGRRSARGWRGRGVARPFLPGRCAAGRSVQATGHGRMVQPSSNNGVDATTKATLTERPSGIPRNRQDGRAGSRPRRAARTRRRSCFAAAEPKGNRQRKTAIGLPINVRNSARSTAGSAMSMN